MAELVSFSGALNKIDYAILNVAKKDRDKKIDINKNCVCEVKHVNGYEYTVKAVMETSFTPRALFRLKCVYDIGIIFDEKPTKEEFNEAIKNYISHAYREISLLVAILTRATYNDSIIEEPDGYDLVIQNFE